MRVAQVNFTPAKCGRPAKMMLPKRVDLVRCYENTLVEEEWITSLFAPREINWHKDHWFQTVIPGAIYIVPGTFGLPAFPKQFLEAVAEQGDCGLFHLGDEFFRADYRVYSSFAFVVRNYRASWLNKKGVLTLPLGYTPGLAPPAQPKPASERKYLWCFLGARNAARSDLIRAWSRVPRGFISLPDIRAGDKLLSRSDYRDVMSESAFAPAPMGNVVMETWRFWEALELGAIPVAPRRMALDYYRELLGPHPVPSHRTWQAAAAFVSRFENDPVGLNSLQAEVLNWWSSQKADVSRRLAEHIARGQAGQFKPALSGFADFSKSKNQVSRVVEFLKHHDSVALRGRASIALGRMLRTQEPVQKAHPLTSAPSD
jgi:hypothetical protein